MEWRIHRIKKNCIMKSKITKHIMAAFFLMLPLTSFGQLPNSNKISHYNAEKVVLQSSEVARSQIQ